MPVLRGKKPAVTAGSRIPKLTAAATENQVRAGLHAYQCTSMHINAQAVNKGKCMQTGVNETVCVAGGRPAGEEVLLTSSWSPQEEDRLHRHHQCKTLSQLLQLPLFAHAAG